MIDLSVAAPSWTSLLQTMFCTLVGNSTTISVIGLYATHPETMGASCTPRAVPASFTRMPTWPGSTRVQLADPSTHASTSSTSVSPTLRTMPPIPSGLK